VLDDPGGGTLRILDHISFHIGESETAAIVGVSGSGKSTLLGIMAGLDLPSHGRVLLDGVDLTTLDEDARARLRSGRVGFVFQDFQLLSGLTALENVLLPLELAGHGDAMNTALTELRQVGLGERVHHYPRQLSGGEQQRLAIARAYAVRPRILFADEPTGNLDQRSAQRVIELLFSLNASHGTTLVLVTHDTGLAQRCARVFTLDAGRLAEPAHGGNPQVATMENPAC